MSNKRSNILIRPANDLDAIAEPAEEVRTFFRLEITERQLEVLAWVQEGKSASDIGGILGLSHRTVEHHLEKVCRHLGVRTRFQAVLRARDLGLIPMSDGREQPSLRGRLTTPPPIAP